MNILLRDMSCSAYYQVAALDEAMNLVGFINTHKLARGILAVHYCVGKPISIRAADIDEALAFAIDGTCDDAKRIGAVG